MIIKAREKQVRGSLSLLRLTLLHSLIERDRDLNFIHSETIESMMKKIKSLLMRRWTVAYVSFAKDISNVALSSSD